MTSSRVHTAENTALSFPAKSYAYRFWLSACFLSLVCFLLATGGSLIGAFVLSLLALLFCADILFKNAWRDIKKLRISLSVLSAFGVSAAFCFSLSKTFFIKPLAGETPELYIPLLATICLYLWSCARFARSKERTGVFIKKLDDFLPKSGRLLDGRREMMVFSRELKTGDIIKVKAGERIPCEGKIVKGKTAIDESLITGNMLPTSKKTGSLVYAGTLNKGGDICVEVGKTLENSVISGIIKAIKNSERRRCVRRDRLDAYAPWMLVSALLLAAGAYIYYYWQGNFQRPLHTVGFFLTAAGLACPWSFFFCAVFPAWAVRAGARRKRINLQSLGALEVLSGADVLFFDKTGTLTYGELRIASVHAPDAKTRRTLLEALATAEQWVDGPFANAVNLYAREHKVAVRKLLCFDVYPGLGIKALSGKNTLLAGRPEWLEEQGVPVTDKPQAEQAVICGAKNGAYLGYVLLDDALRPGAAEMVATLKALGKEVVLMSGDNEASVGAIAKETGIDQVNFSMLPQTKAEVLSNYVSLGKKTVMVGDGFNDITALLRADASVAFSSGKNVYNNWVDIIIRRADLASVTDLFVIDKKLSACVNGNVFLCWLCNTVLTAWLLFSSLLSDGSWYFVPVGLVAGAAVVFLNSARLLHIK